jgi:hypothetical protein
MLLGPLGLVTQRPSMDTETGMAEHYSKPRQRLFPGGWPLVVHGFVYRS